MRTARIVLLLCGPFASLSLPSYFSHLIVNSSKAARCHHQIFHFGERMYSMVCCYASKRAINLHFYQLHTHIAHLLHTITNFILMRNMCSETTKKKIPNERHSICERLSHRNSDITKFHWCHVNSIGVEWIIISNIFYTEFHFSDDGIRWKNGWCTISIK